MRFLIKLSISVCIIVLCTQIGRKLPTLAPSILFFLVAFACFRKHLSLWIVLSASFAVWLIAAVIHQLLLNK